MKKTTIPLIIFLIIALVGGLMLVRQSQETRRGATFANTTLTLLPSEKIIKKVGEVVPVKVYFQAETGVKVDGVQTVVCYGDGLTLDAETGVVTNVANGFESSPIVNIKDVSSEGTTSSGKCVTLVATSKKAADQLVTTGEVFSINFKAVKPGEGNLVINKEKSMVTGDNPASETDKEIAVTSVANTTYKIDGELVCNLKVDPPERCPDNYTCIEKSIEGPTPPGYREGDGICVPGCMTDADCPSGQECWQPPMPDCPTGTECIQVMPPKECRVPPTTDTPILNFKVSFGSVKVADGKCAVNWPMQIIVMSGGDTKVYSNVKATLVNSTGTLNVYKGSLPLVGFNHLTNVAVFIKGPKHLQMKYAVQNQTKNYGKAGGELTLTNSIDTSPVYNFTGYPMLPGDIVGASLDSAPNGEINGVDFAYLKTQHTEEAIAAGGYIKGDLDGNCQINSNDTNILKISLETKQGELY